MSKVWLVITDTDEFVITDVMRGEPIRIPGTVRKIEEYEEERCHAVQRVVREAHG